MTGFMVPTEVSLEIVRNLLCCAFEGGSNYWYDIAKAVPPPGLTLKDYEDGGKGQDAKSYWHWSQLIPTQEGGQLIITSKEGDVINGNKKWTLDRNTIQQGLVTMREKYPSHFGDVISENEDATTGDVFLQSCLFGVLIYG